MINLYRDFSIPQEESLENIRNEVKRQIQARKGKARRKGDEGNEARDAIKLLENSLNNEFYSEDNKRNYDEKLESFSSESVETEENWLRRAWSLYYSNDMGAARVAARKAREQYPNKSQPLVVSSWIELQDIFDESEASNNIIYDFDKNEAKVAMEYANEAYVFVDSQDQIAEVLHARGEAFRAIQKYNKSRTAFEVALSFASDEEKPEIYKNLSYLLAVNYLEYNNTFETVIKAFDTNVSIPFDVMVGLLDSLGIALSVGVECEDEPIKFLNSCKEKISLIKNKRVEELVLQDVNDRIKYVESKQEAREIAKKIETLGIFADLPALIFSKPFWIGLAILLLVAGVFGKLSVAVTLVVISAAGAAGLYFYVNGLISRARELGKIIEELFSNSKLIWLESEFIDKVLIPNRFIPRSVKQLKSYSAISEA